MGLSKVLSLIFLAASVVSASAFPQLPKRCTNSASNRTCWGNHDITTDYYNQWPDTGVTVEYWFDMVNVTAAPDGVSRTVLLINGTLPGPTIEANWGDTIVVHVRNSMANNGTGLHFHGIRQYHTVQNDGVPSITQCPIAPGESYTYTWKATQYGSSWYHSHFTLQAWEGLHGGIVIHGPASSNYDEDLGILFINDWFHTTVHTLYHHAETLGPPTPESGLINGTNVYGSGGSRFQTTFVSGKKYLIRLVNSAIDSQFKFTIDCHNMTVIATDFVPIKPYSTQELSIGIGQRYDIIVEANAATDNYWMRAIPQISCNSNGNATSIKGIIRYDSNFTLDPTTSAYNFTDSCNDEALTNLVPYVSKDLKIDGPGDDLVVTLETVNSVFKWFINSTTMSVDWADPSLLRICERNNTWGHQSGVILLPNANQFVYFIIETAFPVAHPIHLHGHDFYILAQGTGTFDSASPTLITSNPPRRDVAMLPASGYLVIGFETDNPGAWLMHCHIGWHTNEGFALQFIERSSEIPALLDFDKLSNTCTAWNSYVDISGVVREDSGV